MYFLFHVLSQYMALWTLCKHIDIELNNNNNVIIIAILMVGW